MATATKEHLDEVRRRINRLEVKAQRGTADAKSMMQRYIDTLRRTEESARASARERDAAVDERLEQLENEVELAEHRLAVEFADTNAQFADALEAELRSWDTYLDRSQTKAAAKTGASRQRAETAITDLRQRRVSIGQSRADVGTAAGEGWRETKTHVLAELDELKSKADAAQTNAGGDT